MDEQGSTCTISQLIFDVNKKLLSEEYSSYYDNNELSNLLAEKISENKTLIAHSSKEALENIVLLGMTYNNDNNVKNTHFLLENTNNNIDLVENAVKCLESKTLSRKGRVNIQRSCDLFCGVYVSCVNPSDIVSATLYATSLFPKNFNKIVNKDNFEDLMNNIDICDTMLKSTEIHYIPIKTITKFESNYITFFKNPLILSNECFRGLSIEIVLKNNIQSIFNQPDKVIFDMMMLNSNLRNEFMEKSKKYEDYFVNNKSRLIQEIKKDLKMLI